MERMVGILVLVTWTVLWAAGGWLLAEGVFRLRRDETGMVGFALGLVLQVWLANLLSQLVAIPVSFWLSSVVVLLAGIAARVRSAGGLRLEARPMQWMLLGALTLLFNAIGRGLGVFDDYQNLPTVSLMAAGDVPPHFALDPSVRFGYHYLLLLFAAELMRLGNMLPWSALDLARGLMLALPLVLAGMWAFRLTRRRLAAFLGVCVLALAGGARWLLLLLPVAWLNRLSQEITLIGSAATSAESLAEALVSSWKIDGAGPIPFPFAFYSGVNQPYIMAYTGIAGSGILIVLLLLLTSQRWKRGSAAVVTAALLAALAVANEIAFLLIGVGLLIAGLAWILSGRRPAEGKDLLTWLAISAAALTVGIIQGGMLTEIVQARLRHDATVSSYFDPTPALVWPPALVSAHLGSLSLANPAHLIGALLEIGPIVLVSPLVVAWGWRSLRLGNWFEVSLIASSAGVLAAVFSSFKGPLFTAAPRLMSGWFLVSALYFVPLLWIWSAGRREAVRIGALVAGLISCLGGMILFGAQLAAIQKPVYATFISQLDAKMAEEQWNKLGPGELVFDPLVFRAPTVFGRPTRSSPTWYTRSEEWEKLRDTADPYRLRRAGFAYMYFDSDYWEGLNTDRQAALAGSCVKEVLQVDGIHSETDYSKDFRRLLDIRSCE
ncbi:MAG: hypothetical protein V1755_04900 [Chloroflexota bacterium]